MKIVSFNTEDLSFPKADLIVNLNPDMLCLQETHIVNKPPKIPGMYLAVYSPSRVHGSAIFTRDKTVVTETAILSQGPIEILELKTKSFNVISVYNLPTERFFWPIGRTMDDLNPT